MTDLICIVCPRGCHLHVDDDLNVTGNFCPRGAKYGKEEVTSPKRMITATVQLESSSKMRLPVISSNPVPKDKIFDVMKIINKTKIKAPVKMGQVIIENILDLNIDIVSAISVE